MTEENKDIHLAKMQEINDQVPRREIGLALSQYYIEQRCWLNLPKFKLFELDFQSKLDQEVAKLTELKCTRNGNKYLFQFYPVIQASEFESYFVQLVNINATLQIGKWMVPMSVDVPELLLEFPLKKLKNLRQFLKHCEHLIHCFSFRREQYKELQVRSRCIYWLVREASVGSRQIAQKMLSDLQNCSISTNLGYTRVDIEMSRIEDIASNEMHNIELVLFYKPSEIQPYMLQPESFGRELSETYIDMFTEYFKAFLKVSLKNAFLKTVTNPRAKFKWERLLRDSIFISESNSSDDELISLENNEGRKSANDGHRDDRLNNREEGPMLLDEKTKENENFSEIIKIYFASNEKDRVTKNSIVNRNDENRVSKSSRVDKYNEDRVCK